MFKSKTLYFLSLCFVLSACVDLATPEELRIDPIDRTDGPLILSDFWYGYYYEDAISNPEDPTPGFIYLQIPETGSFSGEMYFSFSGCDDTFDVGAVSGAISGNSITGSWSGNVDGVGVGGDYIGALSSTGDEYSGTYTNAEGKVEIECSTDDSIFVAPNGTWFLGKGNDNVNLDIEINTTLDPFLVFWNDITDTFIYLYVVVDVACLNEGNDLESCLMWSGSGQSTSFQYGEDSIVPAKTLIEGETYLISVTAVSDTGQPISTSNFSFVR